MVKIWAECNVACGPYLYLVWRSPPSQRSGLVKGRATPDYPVSAMIVLLWTAGLLLGMSTFCHSPLPPHFWALPVFSPYFAQNYAQFRVIMPLCYKKSTLIVLQHNCSFNIVLYREFVCLLPILSQYVTKIYVTLCYVMLQKQF